MTSPTKCYHVIQIILLICSCDQSLVTAAFLWEKLSQPQFYKDLTRKTTFFEGWSWFKFNNLGLALSTGLKFYISVVKVLKLKVRKVLGLIPTFVEVTGEKLVGRSFCSPPPSTILNRVNFMLTVVINIFGQIKVKVKKFNFCYYKHVVINGHYIGWIQLVPFF